MVKQSPITEDFMVTPVCVFTHVYLNFEFVLIIFSIFSQRAVYTFYLHTFIWNQFFDFPPLRRILRSLRQFQDGGYL